MASGEDLFRPRSSQVPSTGESAAKSGGTGASGRRHAVALFARFRDQAETPLPPWSEHLFDPHRPGSFSHFYHTMSFGQFRVTGMVDDRQYESEGERSSYLANLPAEPGNFGRFSLEILEQADAHIDFSDFDNDGPDGLPNSGDDDGFVDAVFIVLSSVPRNFFLGGSTGGGPSGFASEL